MSLIDLAIDAACKIADGAEKEGGKTLFTQTVGRLIPTARKKLIKRLFESFAGIMRAEYSDHADLVGDAEDALDKALAEFLKLDAVRDYLVEPLYPDVAAVRSTYLAAAWLDRKLWPLPKEFDWGTVGKRYLNQVRKAMQDDPDLRDRWSLDTLQKFRETLERLAPPDHGFQLELYRARICERYGYLKFDSFHVTGSDIGRIELRHVFVAPDAKEDLPPLDIPKEELLKMAAEGELDARAAEALGRDSQAEDYRRRYQEAPARNVFELLRGAQHAVVIGDPGSGKSSLLQEMLLAWAEHPEKHPFPLMVELRQCALEKCEWAANSTATSAWPRIACLSSMPTNWTRT